jgi:hypothetical protein
MQNTQNTETEVTKFPEGNMITPIKRMKMVVSPGFTATLKAVKPFADTDRDGNKMDKLRLTFDTEEGEVYAVQNIHTAGCRQYILNAFNRALGCKTLSDIAKNIGKQVTLVTELDQYSQTVKVKYINRYNPYAGETVDLSAFDEEVAAEPEKLVFG